MIFQENFTVQELNNLLKTGQVSSRELTLQVLERVDRLEPRLHAFITLTPELALHMADNADRRWHAWRKDAQEDIPPLLG
ncbi:MAG: Asp-tRNA(Asn)/Glu-tRNA(Gln) amidotransferase GatCAB subunit A, partial [Anaerolineaceae bacterium]|nr:Asp-tRNA(Asn)/Glu-tRNA(Gln) amidotransferase GatCAB subunit A [Anaerolineaceae bacterium]